MTQPPPNLLDQTLANRLHLEQTFIAAAGLDPDYARQVAGWLAPDRFHDERCARIWQRVQAGETVWAVTQADAELDFAVTGWIANVHSAYMAADLAKQISRQAYVSDLLPNAAGLAKALAGGDYQTATGLLRTMAEQMPQTGAQVHGADDVGAAFLVALDQEQRNVSTRLTDLDKATGGLERQTLTILAAPASTGKSALALQIARNVAHAGGKALFVSLEMSEVNLFARLACGDANVSWLDARRGLLGPVALERLRNCAAEVAMRFNRHLLIHDKPSSTADIWELVATEKPDLVIVDHIRFCTDENEREVKRLGVITARLRDLSHQFDCAVLALAQINREYHSRAGTDARPVLTDLRDSGEIEENADNVWMLYVPTDGTATKPDLARVPMELLIRKARDGVRDALVNLVYNRTRQLIRSRSDPEEV